MSTVATRLMTADEFYDWANSPENRDRPCELERGAVVDLSFRGKRHGMVCANVAAILGNHAANRGRGFVCANNVGVLVECDPDTVRGPDVLFFDDEEEAVRIEEVYSATPPHLAVEVLSTDDTYARIIQRVVEFLRMGTPLVWILDPDAENIMVWQPGTGPDLYQVKVVKPDGELTGETVLPDFRCRVAELYALPGKRVGQ